MYFLKVMKIVKEVGPGMVQVETIIKIGKEKGEWAGNRDI